MKRQATTLLYLVAATGLSWLLAGFKDTLLFLAPILFGLGLTLSNSKYERFPFGNVVVLAAFFIIYIWGTIPFYLFGNLFSNDLFICQVFGFFGAFALVMTIVRLIFVNVRLETLPILMIFIFPVVAAVILSLVINHKLFFFKPGDIMSNFIPTMVIVQLLMSINIAAAIKPENQIINA